MQRHAGPRRGARAAGMTLPDGPQRAHASRASHAPRMGPHAHGADPLACVKWHAPPCSGMRAPCEAPGRLGRALPLARSGPAPVPTPHGPRMGPHGPSSAYPLACGDMACAPMRRHAGPCAASGWLGRALPSAGCGPAPAARRMRGAWARMGRAALTSTRRCMCSPCSGSAGPLRGARAAGPRPSVGPQRARVSRGPHAPHMGPHGPMHEQERRRCSLASCVVCVSVARSVYVLTTRYSLESGLLVSPQRASWQRCAAMRGQSRPAPCSEHAESP
jgi:hypothetical protein